MGNGRGAPGRRVEARGAGRIEGRIGNWYGAIAAALVPPALAAALDQAHHELNLTSTALLFLAAPSSSFVTVRSASSVPPPLSHCV